MAVIGLHPAAATLSLLLPLLLPLPVGDLAGRGEGAGPGAVRRLRPLRAIIAAIDPMLRSIDPMLWPVYAVHRPLRPALGPRLGGLAVDLVGLLLPAVHRGGRLAV